MLPFPHSILLRDNFAKVIVTDVQSSVANLSVYTFSACNVDFGSVDPCPTIASVPRTGLWVRSKHRNAIYVIVHAEDAAMTFNVTAVSIGGVNGAEMIDRGGGTNRINTAIYRWPSEMLAGITNTDIVVRTTEAVTSCAIGVLSMSNIIEAQFIGSNSGTGTAAVSLQPTIAATQMPSGLVSIIGMTASDQTESPSINCGISGGTFEPILLYHESNAEMGYAAYWAKYPCLNSSNESGIGFICDWDGAGTHDAVAVTLYG